MIKFLQTISFCLLFLIIIASWPVHSAQALEIETNPIVYIYRVTDTITRRVSDIIYYLVKQKRYIFENFTDPNNYNAWEVPEDFDKVFNVLVSTSSDITPVNNTSAPITVTETVIPTPKPVQVQSFNHPEILIFTNLERQKLSLKPLFANSVLDTIASLRVDDLFANQYFEHESPDGRSAPDLAKKVGYNYTLIGENLALGIFAGNKGIVTAWMESPGHRANILNSQYTELGVSVKEGKYKGQVQTIAVQIFGNPLSACTKPNAHNKSLIDSSTQTIKQMQTQAQEMYTSLDSLKNNPETESSYYYQKVQEYNYLAKRTNDAVLALKNLVDSYNLEVSRYNSCISL